MSNLSTQKRLAASVMKCGENRVWLDPERMSDIEAAISRDDIRNLISEGAITSHQKKGVSRGRARAKMAKRSYGHCKGAGRRKGAGGTRAPGKRQWIRKIRAQRRVLREMRDGGDMDRALYRLLYRRASGGQYRSVAHLKAQSEIISGRMK